MKAVHLDEIEARRGTRVYPQPLREPFENREKRRLGDAVGISQFGVNYVKLEPGAWSAWRHWHKEEDEFVYVVKGEITVVNDQGESQYGPGTCIGFKAGVANAHHIINKSEEDAEYIEAGSRYAQEEATYEEVDLHVKKIDYKYHFFHKDGEPYD